MKGISITIVGGAVAALLSFWAMSSATADTSSGFQNAAVLFEKEVKASDVIVGIGDDRVGILRDVDGDTCEVQTWQAGERDGKTTLRIDTGTVDGVCATTTDLPEPGSTADSRELLYDIDTPLFTFQNLGGRVLTFDDHGAATLADGAKPDGVKQGDWDDTRPYKVALELQTLNADTAKVSQEAVATGYTQVQNVAEASDWLRFVPAPDEAPIPGPVTIAGVTRSETTGTVIGGVREGIAVTYTGGVCTSGPTKVTVTYTQQSPVTAPPVTTVQNIVLTGGASTVHLGSVPNGASGTVDVAAVCVPDGAVVREHTGYTQPVPATVLTVKPVAGAKEKQDLSWTKVSSLPTSFEVRWSVGSINNEVLTTTSALKYRSVNDKGANLGLTTKYSVVATVDATKSPAATGELATGIDQPGAVTITTSTSGASWTAVTCEAYTKAQYAVRYYQQSGTSTAVAWTPLTSWATTRSITGVTTPAYGRTVYEVHSRCLADKTAKASAVTVSNKATYYAPEAVTVSTARSATAGAVYQGYHEGMEVTYTGGRCYNGTSSDITVTWTPASPSGQKPVTSTATKVLTSAAQKVQLADVKNGAKGSASVDVTCAAGTSKKSAKAVSFTQTVPTPVATVAQGSSDNRHEVSWAKVSSLPTDYTVKVSAAYTVAGAHKAKTTTGTSVEFLLTSDGTTTGTQGITYGNKHTYSVTAAVQSSAAGAKTSAAKSITTAWPATPKTTVTSNGSGASWTAISCPSGTSGQYASHYYKQTGTSTTVSWSALTDWSTARSFSGVTTPAYGRTVSEAQTRCQSSLTKLTSPVAKSGVDSFYKPEAVVVASVGRSTSAGTAYQGAREGALVKYTGGRCYKGTSSKIVVSWNPSSQSGQSAVTNTATKALSTTAQQVNLSNVKNGAKGSVGVEVTCTAGKSDVSGKDSSYTQPLPTPVLSVKQGASPEQHIISWNKVSSLSTTFQATHTDTKSTGRAQPGSTTGTSQTLGYAAGSLYGNEIDYKVKATVNGTGETSATKSYTTQWGAVPQANANVKYTRTGAGGLYQAGTLTWTFDAVSCPAGTTRQNRVIENRTGQPDGSISTKTMAVSDYFTGTSYAWAPSYSREGYTYAVRIDANCKAKVTGIVSGTTNRDSAGFLTPMAQPKAPVYNGVSLVNGQPSGSRPMTATKSTCDNSSSCASIRIDYKTFCPDGSKVNWSTFYATSWTGVRKGGAHPFGMNDYWKNTTGKDQQVTYSQPRYTCITPHSKPGSTDAYVGPQSAIGADQKVWVWKQ